ncbi:MAG: SpoVG family protein [Fibrobacterota bacterium]
MTNALLDITELKIMPSKWENSPTRALCSATFNGSLVVHGIRIMEGKKGIYVAFPLTGGRGSSHTGRRPIVYPANPEIRKEISNRILATYVINHCVDEYTI